MSRRASTLLMVVPMILVIGLFLIIPLLGLLEASFKGTGTAGFPSLEHYDRALLDPFYLRIFAETIGYGLLCTFISIFLGFPVGYAMGRMSPNKRRWYVILVILPLTLSLIVIVFGWLVLLGRNGVVNSLLLTMGIVDTPKTLLFNGPAVIVVLVMQFLPFMILSIMSVVVQIDPALELASANLKATRWVTLRRVVLPLSMPGIIAGSSLVFTASVSAFVTPRLIGGQRVQMIGSIIYDQILTYLNWGFGSALAFILLELTIVVTAASRIRIKREQDAGSAHA
ncbi:ABC transporter permease [Bradyrhizobium canariense]|nr:ABC transporter permease [Bradyrhizobium canariense]